MNIRDELHIKRIKEELNFICKALYGKEKESFLNNDILQHAVSMSFITIGECANHLSEDFKNSHPEIEWVQIIAVRNIAAHGYWQLSMEQIWQSVIEDIPILIDFFEEFD